MSISSLGMVGLSGRRSVLVFGHRDALLAIADDSKDDRSDDQGPDHEVDGAAGEEDQEVTVMGLHAVKEVQFEGSSQNEANEESGDLDADLHKDETKGSEDQRCPYINHHAAVDGIGADDAHQQN